MASLHIYHSQKNITNTLMLSKQLLRTHKIVMYFVKVALVCLPAKQKTLVIGRKLGKFLQ
jgi:hypothetical protein